MLLRIDRGGRVPIHRQIFDQVAGLVENGSLRPGERLPATRALAAKAGVNRSTVYRAYQELWARGYLEARPGSYSTVRSRLRPVRPVPAAAAGRIDWGRVSAPAARRMFDDLERMSREASAPAGPRDINFSTLTADRALCPVDALKRAVRKALDDKGRELLDYGDPAGYRPLRETLARAMRVHGISVGADEILVTNGSQHGLDLVLDLLGRPGAIAATESPTYSFAIPLLRFHGLAIREIPMRPDGMDLDALEKRLSRERVALVYTVPNFHNPTGISTSQAHRERLLAICEARGVPIVEDGFEEELKYFGKVVLPVKSMDSGGIVIYLGTFSKVVFPGLRVGWIAAHRDCIRRLLAINRFCALSGSTLGQAALARFCDEGSYEEHVRRVHKAYRRRMEAMLRGLKAHLPARGVEWTEPAGGYTLWVRVTAGRDVEEHRLFERLRKEGVLVTPGSLSFPGRPGGVSFRLSVCNLREEQIEEGCRRLGRVLARAVGE
jgi:DNA-binding transcriptional MocR family regulator